MHNDSSSPLKHKPYVWGYPRIWFVLSYKSFSFGILAGIFWFLVLYLISGGKPWTSGYVLISTMLGSIFVWIQIRTLRILHLHIAPWKQLSEYRRLLCPLCGYPLYEEDEQVSQAICPECGCSTKYQEVYTSWSKALGKHYMNKHGFINS